MNQSKEAVKAHSEQPDILSTQGNRASGLTLP